MSYITPNRVLLIGLGSIGRRYCRLIHKTWPSIQMAALRSGYGKQCVEEQSLRHCFVSIDEAFAWKPDMVIVASPANFHIHQSLQFACREIPLLIEKPVGTGNEDPSLYRELLIYAQSLPIYVGYVLRHDPCAAFIREQLASGKLGALISADLFCGSWLPDWRPGLDYRESVSSQRELGGGALLELSHELDMAQWLLGPLTLRNSFLRSSGILDLPVEDQVYMLAQLHHGSPVSIRLDFCSNPARRKISLRFASSELTWDLMKGTVSHLDAKMVMTLHQLGATSDERLCRQLELFWQRPQPHQTSLCSLEEGLKVLDLIVHARHLADKP